MGLLNGIYIWPQNGEGQFHKNAYTESKFLAIFDKLVLLIQKLQDLGGKEMRYDVISQGIQK